MRRLPSLGWVGFVCCCLLANTAFAANSGVGSRDCTRELTKDIPVRGIHAPSGSAVMQQVMNLNGAVRDEVVGEQVLSGNVPAFLRDLAPVTFSGKMADGTEVSVTICVTPDYLAIGNDSDFVRMPMGLPEAAKIADRFGFLLPTTKMVDAIYAQAGIRLAPRPMQPTNQMSSTDYLMRHNQTVEGQRTPFGQSSRQLTAGQKKDIVLSNRLLKAPGRVAIYGWHRENGVAIQPLSTVHGAQYADYSHGVRLVSATAFVNGKPRSLSELMQDEQLAWIVSSEGPIRRADGLLASLYR